MWARLGGKQSKLCCILSAIKWICYCIQRFKGTQNKVEPMTAKMDRFFSFEKDNILYYRLYLDDCKWERLPVSCTVIGVNGNSPSQPILPWRWCRTTAAFHPTDSDCFTCTEPIPGNCAKEKEESWAGRFLSEECNKYRTPLTTQITILPCRAEGFNCVLPYPSPLSTVTACVLLL